MAEESGEATAKRESSSADQESDSSQEFITPPPAASDHGGPSPPMPKWVLRKVQGPAPYTEPNADARIPPHFTIEPALRPVPLSDPRSAVFHSRDSEILYLCLEATGGLDNLRVDFFEAPGADGTSAVFLGILLSAEDLRRRKWEAIERSAAVQSFIRGVFGPYGVPVRFFETTLLMP